MITSDSVVSIFPALAKAQATFPAIRRDAENPHLGSRYADLAAILEAVRKPLADNSLAVIQTSAAISDEAIICGVTVITTLIHSSGEWIRGELAVPLDGKDTRKTAPQQVAASFTFGRRHGLMALLGIAAEEEKENGAGTPGASQQRSPQAAAAPLNYEAAYESLSAVTTAAACVAWRNDNRKSIQSSPDRERIQEEFTRRLKELQAKEAPK